MSVTFVNQFLGLAQGPIEHDASSIINAVCGDDNLAIGDIVRVLPLGTGNGFTQSDDILPRVGIVSSFATEGFGIVIGGDFEGVYSEGTIDTSDLSSGIIVSFFGDGVRVCTQGRCLALADGTSTGTIGIGDALTTTISNDLVKASDGNIVIGRALQATSLSDSIIVVDIQREGIIPGESTAYKKELTVEAIDVTGASPLVDFPLLVSITDTDLRDNARSDGFDIFFTESDGTTVIPYDREAYDNSTGTLVAWVLTTLSDTVDNKIFMFYGNPNATDQQDPLPVWNTRFEDVFHFNQTSPLPWNNSSVGKDFTILDEITSPTPVVGEIDTASDISVTTNANQISFRMVDSGTISPTDFFASAWVKFDAISTDADTFLDCWVSDTTFVGDRSAVTIGSGVQGAVPDNEKIELIISDDGGFTEILIGDMADLAYHHVAIRYLSGSFDVFFDGSFVSSTVFAFTDPISFDDGICGGGEEGLTSPQTGRIDELQVAHDANFSNGFITTSFDNQKDSGQGAGNFVKVGPQQSN